MPTGVLESFVVEKGFGFIVPDAGKGKVYAQIGQFKGGEEDIAKLVTGGGGQRISYVLDPEKKMVKTALQWSLKGEDDPPEPEGDQGDGSSRTGKMRSFDAAKGFGFIVPDRGGENIFCHARQFEGDGVDDIQKDDRVVFETDYDEKKGKTKASRWCREDPRQSRDAGNGRNGDRRGRSRSRSRGYRPAYGAPPPGYGAPPPGYGYPPPGYGMPPPGYGMPPHQPPPGYGAPPPGYGAPPPGYGAPPGYGPPPGKGGPYGAPQPYGPPPAAYGAPPPHGYGGPPGPHGAPPGAAAPAPAPAQQSQPLPADWDQMHDPASGKPYYVNRVTRETTWTLPAAPVGNAWGQPAAAAPGAVPAARPALPAALPEGYEQHADPSSGKPYFVNTKTGETSWTPPAAAGAETPPAAREAPPAKGEWDQMTDPASGRPYYVNRSTGETSWTPPLAAAGGAEPAPVAGAPKENASSSPADWEELKDPANGRFYYRHRRTGETSWTPSSPPQP